MTAIKIEPKSKVEPAESESEQTQFREAKKADWNKLFSESMTATEIMNTDFPEMKWVVDDLIPEGLTLIAGQSKAGKSWLLLSLSIAVTSNKDFLGAFPTSGGKVLYLALEDTARRIQSRILFQEAMPNNKLIFLHQWKDNSDALDYYLEMHNDVKIIIIDTWGRFIAGACRDGNDYNEVTVLIGQLQNIAKKHGAAIIVCTHTKKGMGATDWLDDVLGSKALVAVADTILKLSRDRNSTDGTLSITGRDVEERDVNLEKDEKWRWHVSALQGINDGQRKVLTYLKQNSGYHSERTIQQNVAGYSTKGGSERLESDLLALREKNVVDRRIETGKNGQAVSEWKYRDETDFW